MSVQSIKNISLDSLCNNALKDTIENANKLLLKERFNLGNGYCEKNEFHNSMIREITKTDSKELICYINTIIENGPKDCKN